MLARLLLAAATLAATPALAASPTLPKSDAFARTRGLIDAFEDARSPPEGGALTAAEHAHNAAVFKKLDDFFDWDKLLALPIEPHRAQFTPEQLERYRTVFRAALRLIAYPDSGTFFHEAKWSLKRGPVNGDKADVALHARLEEEDVETDALFHWVRAQDTWRLVDVSFDGASLAHDYQNQFGRIIKKDGVDGLLKKLSERYEQARKTRGALE